VLVRTLAYFGYGDVIQRCDTEVQRNIIHGTTLEIVWTVLPSLVLVVVALHFGITTLNYVTVAKIS
jgi:heme/copper-type cytochrome/quinol oxidase subunit 2